MSGPLGGNVLAVLLRSAGEPDTQATAAQHAAALATTTQALRSQSVQPAEVLALTASESLAAAVDSRAARLGNRPEWIWVLSPGTAPGPGALAALLEAAAVTPSLDVLAPHSHPDTADRHPWEGALVRTRAVGGEEWVAASVPRAQTGAVLAENRPTPGSRSQTLAGAPDDADRGSAQDSAAPQHRTLGQLVAAPPVLLVAFLVGLSFAVNRARIGVAASGGGLLPAPSGATTLFRAYLQEWHAVAGGTSSPAAALSGLLGLIGLPFGGADHAVAVLLIAAMPLAGLSAYLATRATELRRGHRAVLAAVWALMPIGASASAQGHLDTVFTYVLLPIVLAGVVSVLRGAPAEAGEQHQGRTRWLSTTAATALGLAALTSASPLMYLLVVLVALIGFVALRPAAGSSGRRAVSLFFVVLLPVGLLLPWPAVLLTNPEIFLHGVGSTGSVPAFSLSQLLTLGYGLSSVAGAVLGLAAVAALIARPSLRMLPGLGVVVLGVGAAVVVAGQRRPRLPDAAGVAGNPGPALLLVALGLLLLVVVGVQQQPRGRARAAARTPQLAVLGGVLVLALAVGAVLGGSDGGVRAGAAPALPATLHAELVAHRALVLTTAAGDQPARLSTPALPQLGDDDLVPTPGAARRLQQWSTAITNGEEKAVAAAVAAAAASGVGAVVLPAGARLGSAALASLLTEAELTTDGRTVLQVKLPALGARVLEPGLATAARTGEPPPGSTGETTAAERGTTMVPGAPPALGVRVSAGPDGRLLVLAAEDGTGWDVHVDGVAVAVAPAYGHLVGVALPGAATEVTVQRSDTVRSLLLLVQAAVLLFTLLLAVPPRTHRQRRSERLSPRADRPDPAQAHRRGRWSLRPSRGK